MTVPSFAPSSNASTATTGARGPADREGEVPHHERRDAEACDLDPVDGYRLHAGGPAGRQADTGTGGPRRQGRREGSGAPGRILPDFDDYRLFYYPAGREQPLGLLKSRSQNIRKTNGALPFSRCPPGGYKGRRLYRGTPGSHPRGGRARVEGRRLRRGGVAGDPRPRE